MDAPVGHLGKIVASIVGHSAMDIRQTLVAFGYAVPWHSYRVVQCRPVMAVAQDDIADVVDPVMGLSMAVLRPNTVLAVALTDHMRRASFESHTGPIENAGVGALADT